MYKRYQFKHQTGMLGMLVSVFENLGQSWEIFVSYIQLEVKMLSYFLGGNVVHFIIDEPYLD